MEKADDGCARRTAPRRWQQQKRAHPQISQRQTLDRPLQVGGVLVEGADRFLLVARERENARRQQQEGGKDLHARRRAHARAMPAAAVCRGEDSKD